MNYKVGQRVIAVANGFNYGGSDDPRGSLDTHDYAIGWKGTMGDDNVINFDNGRVIKGCDNNSFELINESEEETVETNAIRGQATQYKVGTKVEIVHLREPKNYPSDFIGKQGIIIEICDHHGSFPFRIEVQGVLMGDYLKWYAEDEFKVIPEFSVGSKVTLANKNDALWLHNGVLESVAIGGDTVFKVTDVSEELQRTIIVSLSTGNAYFVNQRFLKEYVATPKFKRGDWVLYGGDQYYRVVSSKVKDGKVTYEISLYQSTFIANREGCGVKVSEDILKEVQ